MPELCWVYKDDIQQLFTGVNNCATDMLNKLPTYKNEMLLIAHTGACDCISILKYLQNGKPIVKSHSFLHIKATYYNPIQKRK